MYLLYTCLLGILTLAYAPVFLVRRLLTQRTGVGLLQRLGYRSAGLPPEPRCWIHAVSVGEAMAAIPLIHAVRRRWPDLHPVVTTVTPTGARVVKDRLEPAATHRYFPLDFPGAVRRALAGVNPEFFLALETEIWPNFLRALGARGIPAMIANGRISDRSFRRYRLVRPFMRRILAGVTVFAMQSAEDARRVIALGAPPERVVVTGNLKTDAMPNEPGAEQLWRRLMGLTGGEPVWIAGSTHRGEEELLLEAFLSLRRRHPTLVLVIAPRHPERVAEVERLIRTRGLRSVRRTGLPSARDANAVIVLDTVGELPQLYQLSQVVFVGGSLVPLGGHNMLEPALRRKPVVFGPHTTNFREGAELLVTAGAALVVRDAKELEGALDGLLSDPTRRAAMGEAAFEAVAGRQGAVLQTLELIERFLMPA
ncbi:MAG: 3-deoxy-D-manno-octulosonic acid transferase [Candidatus Rokubacteria bacterium]|nr:3-deoxy-D-manno-octulosonic acid transferase [Candidatus Rokubacteria bacterium]MBI2554384.1 3-deoxy-D-manno-octulosonic acid transferase [Candidatus Rokubacteria bacterium]